MGHWGTGISSNDTYQDVYAAFFEYYNNDWEIGKIKEQLIKDFDETLQIDEDVDNFWFALAMALWECRALDKATFDKLNCDHDLKIWRALGATEQDVKKRKIALDKFVTKISTPRDNPKKRKKTRVKIVQPIYDKGDCLVFKMSNGNYGGAIVFEAEQGGENGFNFIASTTINKSERPTVLDFEKAAILTIWDMELYGNIKTKLIQEEFIAYWFQANPYKDFSDRFERIGNMEIKRSFEHTFLGSFRVWIPWDVLIIFSELTFDRISHGQRQNKIVLTKDWSK